MEKVFQQEGIQVEIVSLGTQDIRGCIACNSCGKTGKCAFDDLVNETAPSCGKPDGLVVASPVYYASANGTLVSFWTACFTARPLTRA